MKQSRAKWETDLLEQLATAQAMTGLSYRQICEKAGIPYQAFMLHKRNLRAMREGELHDFLGACEKLGRYK